jgi:hypothetical protein
MIQFLKKPDIKEKRVALALRVIWIDGYLHLQLALLPSLKKM